MYIIETFRGPVKIDADELVKLRDDIGSQLIFFRQGAVNPKQIVRVVEDTERRESMPKMVTESEAEREQRIQEDRSDDIFSSIRHSQPQLANGDKTLLS